MNARTQMNTEGSARGKMKCFEARIVNPNAVAGSIQVAAKNTKAKVKRACTYQRAAVLFHQELSPGLLVQGFA
eukprot:668332-Pelagomonas_calceolata.AAC.1